MGIPDEPFWVPDDVLEFYREAGRRGQASARGLAGPPRRLGRRPGRLRRRPSRPGPPRLAGRAADLRRSATSIATRVASGQCLNALADGRARRCWAAAPTSPATPAPSSRAPPSRRSTRPAVARSTSASASTPWAAVMNGMALHGGTLPVGGTFLVFSDYMRGAVRLSALSEAKVIFSWTHDSVGVGEDGPTHQPIEQIAALRAMPDLLVIRPADANETAEAWRVAVDHDGPTALILSRQNLPVLEGTAADRRGQGRLRAARRRRRRRRSCWSAPAARCGCAVDAADRLAERGRRGPGRVAARAGSCSPCRPTTTATSVLPGRRADAVGRGRRHLRLGRSAPTTPSASTTSGPAPRARSCSRSSASPSTTSSSGPPPCSTPAS